MKVIGFVEGVRKTAGGVGLVGVPMIHQALAARGHDDLLVVAGTMIASGRRFGVRDPADAWGSSLLKRAGTFELNGYSKWYFSPRLPTLYPFVESCDFVTLHSLYSFPVLAGYMMARRLGKPYGLWPHGVLASVQRKIGAKRKSLYDTFISRRILSQASVLFYSAEGERDEARALGLKTPSVVVPHGIDLAPFASLPERGRFRRQYLNDHRGPLVLYLGRLNEKKGLQIFIDAADLIVRAVPETMFAIVGGAHPPSFGRQVAQWAQSSNAADRIVLTGLADENQKLEAFADADVFVLPSEAENFGFAMFESMASGVPVVVSETLDYAAEIRNAGAGLTPPRDAAAFAGAILSLIQDPDSSRQMGTRGLALAAQYSWERCGQLIEQTVDSILDRKPFPAELLPEYPR